VRQLNFYILLVLLFVATDSHSQNNQFKKDSTLAKRYFKLFQKYEYQDTLKARMYSDSAIYFAYKTKDNDLIGRAHQFKGWFFQDCSRFKEANEQFYSSLAYLRKAGSEQGVADAYGNLGNSYLDMDEYRKSLKYQQLSLSANDKIIASNPDEERLNWAEEGRTYALHNIANIYQNIELYEKALEYEYKSIGFELKRDNFVGVAISYNTLAAIHKEMNQVDSAIYFFKKALKIYENHDYPIGLASTLHAYATTKNSGLSKAKRREMLQEALDIFQSRGDIDGETKLLIDIGESQFDELSTDSLSKLLEHIYKHIEEGEIDFVQERYFHLYSRYNSRIGQYDSAYFALENFLELKAVSDEKKRSNDLIAQDIRFELENGFALERLKHQEDINVQQNYIYLSVIGLIIVLVSLFYFIQSNRRSKRVNEILSDKNHMINEQKEIVEEKNRSISDSINYAKRLQTAILPTTDYVNKYLPNSFLLFKPKDIVSGDFHWFEVKDDALFIAAADCTGHGVPGAMVSVVCSNALNQSFNEFGLSEPNLILDKTRELVITRFEKSGQEVVDGMDIALCAIKKNKLIFSGANNPLWVVRKNEHFKNLIEEASIQGDKHSLIEIKGDKQPVGKYAQLKEFTRNEITLCKGDTVYISTDGFADQFGGENEAARKKGGKKFKYKPFKQELLKMVDLSMDEQRERLDVLFNNWKGSLEQVDDVCIIGFRVESTY
jgi:serine phosphatase RsbU (regulator of sigma subunit)/tetratricopeptide (TPR) repeat protein